MLNKKMLLLFAQVVSRYTPLKAGIGCTTDFGHPFWFVVVVVDWRRWESEGKGGGGWWWWWVVQCCCCCCCWQRQQDKECSSSWCVMYMNIFQLWWFSFFHLIASFVVAHGVVGRGLGTPAAPHSVALLNSLYQLTQLWLFLASETVFSVFPLLCTFASVLNKRLLSPLVAGNTKHREREREKEKRESLFHLFHIQVWLSLAISLLFVMDSLFSFASLTQLSTTPTRPRPSCCLLLVWNVGILHLLSSDHRDCVENRYHLWCLFVVSQYCGCRAAVQEEVDDSMGISCRVWWWWWGVLLWEEG